MLIESEILRAFMALIRQELRDTEGLSDISEISLSPNDEAPESISWVLDAGIRMGQVVLWNTGEFEEDLVDVEAGQVRTRSGRMTSDDVKSFLVRVRDWVLHGHL
ncbi:hypothetical protein ACIBI4_13930 [Streptomyces sp. NPDC050418]|uniref:immunity protein TriTu family protein n=1 Tax=Streptomyces sp. NPDC050418 TaxID=3365612 RepID=UPI0037B66B6B